MLRDRGSLPHLPARAVCFLCYRAELDRERSLAAAASLPTGSSDRLPFVLPLEPLDSARLEMLRAARAERRAAAAGADPRNFTGRRRQAQLAARHVLERLGRGLAVRTADRTAWEFPDAWLPFVASR
jgi:hypothetical protein